VVTTTPTRDGTARRMLQLSASRAAPFAFPRVMGRHICPDGARAACAASA